MLRTYRAFTMAEALAAVKRDLGPNAVVLQTRTALQGGILGFGRRAVVEVTAGPPEAMPPLPAKQRAESATKPKREASAAALASGPRAVQAYAGRTTGAIATPIARPVAAGVGGDSAAATVLATGGAEALDIDRDRTRLLAQAMAVTLERERERNPRGAAATAATAHAAATTAATATTSERAAASGSAGTASAPSAASKPSTQVARRFVLVPTVAGGQVASAPPPREVAMPEPRSESDRPATVVATANDDLSAIDRLVDEVLRRGGPSAEDPERLAALYTALVAQEVGEELAREIVDDLRANLSEAELASEHSVRSAAIERIAALLPPCDALGPGERGWRRENRPLTVAFVGPTGVGKTTSVAKIAATLKLRHGARVGLITGDTYRIAAVDQLRTYAEIIGLPLEVVLSPGQMRQSCRRLEDLDVILIDTAGRSRTDRDRLDELRALVAAAEPHETHLVLSSVASARAMEREAAAFAAIGIDKVVLTKLDEAAGLGAALRVLRRVGRGLSYVTTGQEVPQDLEQARPRRLAELVLGDAANAVGARNR